MLCPSCGYDLDKPFVPRSTGWKSQSHAFNGYCAQIARATGNEFSDVKSGIKLRAIKRGFPEPRVVKVKGRAAVEVLKSEADCSMSECSMLVEECIQVAAELDIKLIDSV